MADPIKGTGKKPKGSGRRLYTDENPRDTVKIKFATPADARATVAKVKRVKKPFARYEAEIAEADATANIYLENSVGIGEHPQHIEEVDKQIDKIANAKEKLQVLDEFEPAKGTTL